MRASGDLSLAPIYPGKEDIFAKATISFVSTENVNEDLAKIADFRNCSKSDVLRAFVHDGIQREKALMTA